MTLTSEQCHKLFLLVIHRLLYKARAFVTRTYICQSLIFEGIHGELLFTNRVLKLQQKSFMKLTTGVEWQCLLFLCVGVESQKVKAIVEILRRNRIEIHITT